MRHVFVDRESLQKTPIPDVAAGGAGPWALEGSARALEAGAGGAGAHV